MVDTRYPMRARATARRCLGARTARAVELLGLARNRRKLVARPLLHAALERGCLISALAQVGGYLAAPFAVVTHDNDRLVLVQRLDCAIEIVVLGAHRTRDVSVRELVVASEVEGLRTLPRDQLASPLGLDRLLLQLGRHRDSATPTAGEENGVSRLTPSSVQRSRQGLASTAQDRP